jgi:Tfp pilus assembly protein PilF
MTAEHAPLKEKWPTGWPGTGIDIHSTHYTSGPVPGFSGLPGRRSAARSSFNFWRDCLSTRRWWEVFMRWWGWCVLLMLLNVAGCLAPSQEKVRAFSVDGVHLYKTGAYSDAKESFEAALALKPGDEHLMYNVGQCCDRLGQNARAERIYSDCLQRAPNHAECRHALGALLVREGRWQEATSLVRDWVTRDPKSATAAAEDAWLWRQYGDLPKARTRVEEALALDPHDNRALLEKAQIYETMQRPDRAVYLYEQALQYKPDQPDVLKRVSLLRSQGAERPRPD